MTTDQVVEYLHISPDLLSFDIIPVVAGLLYPIALIDVEEPFKDIVIKTGILSDLL